MTQAVGERGASARPVDRAVRAAIALLALLPLAVLAPRVLVGAGEVAPERGPRLVRALVVTVGAWPAALDGEALDAAEGAGLAELALRGARVERCFAPSRSRAGSAASLWTGRYPLAHGVRSNRLGLEEGAWTVAVAAAGRGVATAAFLEEPFVGTTGVGGFAEVVEEPELGPGGLAARARGFLAEHADAALLVWLHLADAGPRGERLDALLAALFAAPASALEREASLVLVAGLTAGGGEGRDPRAPLCALLPSGLSVGQRGRGAASLVGVAGALCELWDLPGPGVGDAPLDDEGGELWAGLNGASPWPPVLVEGERGPVLRVGRTRVALGEDGALVAEYAADPARDETLAPAPAELAGTMVEQYRAACRAVAARARPARDVRAPAPFAGRNDW